MHHVEKLCNILYVLLFGILLIVVMGSMFTWFLFTVLPQEKKKPLAASRRTSRLTVCFFILSFVYKSTYQSKNFIDKYRTY